MAKYVNTKFNPDGDFKDLETWEAIAQRKATEQSITAKVIGGIVIGGTGIMMGVPALGGVIGAWLLKSAYDGVVSSGNRLKIVRDLGCYAWVLEEADFRTYVRQFGEDAVSNELRRAIDADCELSNFAHNWLRLRGEDPRKIEPSREREEQQSGRSQTVSGQQARQQLETVLNRPLITPPSNTSIKSNTETWNPYASSEIDIIKEAGASIGNLFIVGLGGSGKGMLVACLLREIKANYPNRKVFLINGKDDPKEYGYFEGIVDEQRRLNCEAASPSTVAAWFEAAVGDYDDYALQNNGALLVIDEGTIIGARLKVAKSTALGDKLIGITSSGGSANKNIYFVAQTPYVGANGSDLSAISQLTPLAIIHKSNLAVLDMWKTAKLFRTFNTEEIEGLINYSECDRALYYGKAAKWYVMPKLVNHSGYDRETQTFLNPQDAPKEDITISDDQSEKESESRTLEVVADLSPNAKLILRWLQSDRKDQWVKFKGAKGRDGSFRLLLAENKMNSDMRDDALSELIDAEKIEMSADEQSIKLL
ncbi:hypothetical protein [Tolypothrix sp. VBCCA 56010]|uniref:hypothetical protein n=1 Tax=Tolypothrix sp. VBCCA 56010 TaxID=3137731 RepID=UPI003D7DE940